MASKQIRYFFILFMVPLYLILACQVPEKIVRSVFQRTPAYLVTLAIGNAVTLELSSSPYPTDVMTGTNYSTSGFDTVYPGSDNLDKSTDSFPGTSLTMTIADPNLMSQGTLQFEGSGDYPGINITQVGEATLSYPGFDETSASETYTDEPVQTFHSTTFFNVPSISPTFTDTLFLTPTPSITPTPTKSRTPLPPPPWISSQLHATNPNIVKLSSGNFQLIEFFAYWSGPSQAMASFLYGLENEYRGRINFSYLDIDNPANEIFKEQLRFRIEPHFFLLDPQGKILKEWIGYVTAEQFRKVFDSVLQ